MKDLGLPSPSYEYTLMLLLSSTTDSSSASLSSLHPQAFFRKAGERGMPGSQPLRLGMLELGRGYLGPLWTHQTNGHYLGLGQEETESDSASCRKSLQALPHRQLQLFTLWIRSIRQQGRFSVYYKDTRDESHSVLLQTSATITDTPDTTVGPTLEF